VRLREVVTRWVSASPATRVGGPIAALLLGVSGPFGGLDRVPLAAQDREAEELPTLLGVAEREPQHPGRQHQTRHEVPRVDEDAAEVRPFARAVEVDLVELFFVVGLRCSVFDVGDCADRATRTFGEMSRNG
jgi:hypothetical protein